MEPNQGIKTWQWVVTVIVIIVLIILGYYLFRGDRASAPETETPDTEQVSSSDVNRVVVSDQYPGDVVYITSAQFENPGFVVIRENNNGNPGAIIGQAYFGEGINPGRITLVKETEEGKLYYAVLYSDNGDEQFNVATDLPLKDVQGNTILRTFRVTSTATEIKG